MIGAFLGLKDLRRELAVFACSAIALAAVLGPLLVLFGLKYGVVTSLITDLRSDPRNLEIGFRGNYSIAPADFARLKALPGVGFAVPAPRTISARIDLSGIGTNDRGLQTASVLPSAAGDPLLPRGLPALQAGEVALSDSLAQRLNVKAGDRVVGSNVRTLSSGPEQFELPLKVVHVLDRGALAGERAVLPAETVDRIEAFFDGYEWPEIGMGGKPLSARPRVVETVRLYAQRIEEVAALDRHLTDMGYKVVSRAAEVRSVESLDWNLTAAFGILAAVGGAGYLVSLAVSLWANVERKRQALNVFRLLGASGWQLVAFPLTQAVTIALSGTLLAFSVYFGVAQAVNALLGGTVGNAGRICELASRHFAIALAVTLLSALVAAAVGGMRMINLQPSEALREP
jgi:putative ABC transport system permease protein